MANTKLRFGGQSGLSIGAFIISDTSGLVWNGTAMIAVTSAPTVYAASTVIPELYTGFYSADVPTNLPSDAYLVVYYDLTSGDVVFQTTLEWDGSSVVDDLVTGNSIAEICNKALSHIGVGKTVANMITDTTEEAITCKLFFDTALTQVLNDFPWSFALRFADLALIVENPTTEWAFSYRYPTNCLFIRRLVSSLRNDTVASRIPYRIIGDDSGKLVYTDLTSAQVEYIAKVTNPTRYPPDFILALSYRLASFIAPRLTAGDQYKLGDKALQSYIFELKQAQARDANEAQPDIPVDSEFISERN